jgi:hypothetical protein
MEGLGIRNLLLWNKAAVGKLVWHIAMKQDSLWVKWVHERYVKAKNWWDYEPTSNASWVLKHLSKVKKTLKLHQVHTWPPNKPYSIQTVYHNIILR